MGVKLLGKIKLYEIAKKLGLASKEVVEMTKRLNIDVKNHMSGVEEEEAKRIEESFNKSENKPVEQSKQNVKTQDKKEENAPVIIRREVIITNEEEEKKKKEGIKKEHRNNNIGFVERKQNKDFNIVYRNKPNKPKTVNELFGLNKEEPKKEEKKQEENKEEVKNKDQINKQGDNDIKMQTQIAERSNIIEKTNAQNDNQEIDKKQNNLNKNNNNYNYSNNNRDNKNNNFNRNNNFNSRNSNINNNSNNRNGNRNSNISYNENNRNNNTNYNRNDNPNNNRNNYKNNNYNNQNSNYHNQNNNGNNNNYRRNNNFNNNNNGRNNFNNTANGRNNNYNNNNGNRFNNRRPLDEKGIEKNIKNIMAVETGEKEVVREYNKSIDKQKLNNKFDDNKNKKTKSRKNVNNSFDEGKLKTLKQTNKLSNMFDEQEGGMLDYYDLTTQRGRKGKKKNIKDEERNKQKIFQLTEIEIADTITVKDLATEMKKTTAELIKKLLGYGIMATINQEIDFDTAFLIAGEFGITAKKKETVTDEEILFDDSEDREEDLEVRPPVVVVMGHVDHGKTSLLDTIRKTNVIGGEAGGITQAIGAYKVKVNDREITFLDTPGHEAFTAMRARGAQITDIAILVVAANDGIMPQTIEAINHAKSAGIPIIVAINKIDLPDSNVDKVKQELMTYELVPEEWGGDTICVPISAKNNTNIDTLLEMVLLEADVLELKSNPNKQSKGVVIEARLDKSKGAIATMLVQRGTLDVGDTIIVGSSIGRIRAMSNENGKKVKSAGPSTPVEVMGLTEVPEAGDIFYEVKDEKTAKHLIDKRKREAREKAINSGTKVTLDNLFSQMEEGNLKHLNLIVKADVQGSVEAVKQSMEKLQNEEVKVKVIHAAPGAVNESDVTLAKVSNAIIIAFNVRPIQAAKDMAEKEEVQIKQYSVIYQAIEEVELAMKGMLAPKFEEKVIGNAEVRQTFKISNVGTVAGCFVLTGKVERNAGVRVIRDNVVIHEGKLATLKRFKDEAKEVSKGFECGVQIENFNDVKESDIIEVYVMEEIKR